MRPNLHLSILLLLLMSSLSSTAQVTQLSNNSNLDEGVPLGSIGVMATASDSLWKTDGTSAGTVKYINNVAITPGDRLVFANKIYFPGVDAANGEELWVTDGTTATLVADIETGIGSSSPEDLTLFNNTIYFFATTAADGTELWKSDGTPGNAVMVKDINPTGNSHDNTYTSFFENNGILYFAATNGIDGVELWKTDGTGPGTVMVSNINPSGSSNPFELTALGTEVFFSADDGTNGKELWKTNGTTTTMVKNIATDPGVGSSPFQFMLFNGKLYFSTTIFDISIPEFNYGLWVTDGTSLGTTLVKDGFTSQVFLFFSIFINNKFYFSATTAANGNELWSSDGTPGNTSLFIDINPGPGSASPLLLPDLFGAMTIQDFHTNLYNGKIFFQADNGTDGTELYITNGTVGGTSMVKNINPTGDALGGNFTWFYSQSGMYFAATNGTDGNELWKSDGTSGGTNMVTDLNPTGDSNPEFMMLLGTQLLFTADDGDNVNGDRDLYKLDGIFTPLPINLSEFTVKLSAADALLNWTTLTEINTKDFTIERSYDGQHFESIGNVPASNTSASKHNYSFTDADVATSGKTILYYRIISYDKDGKSETTNVIFVKLKGSNNWNVSLLSNPVHSYANVLLNGVTGNLQLSVRDLNGRTLYKDARQNINGQINIPVTHLKPGMYILVAEMDNERKAVKFVKQ
ncbi:MAG: T9SS type A sorting domain-containing protein [Ginsengibacter sp.]